MKIFFKTGLLSIFIIILSLYRADAQILDSTALADLPVYTSLTAALKNPDSVYKLSLKKGKLTKIPNEVFQFKNLQELDLSKNKLSEIPKEIGLLTHLQKLNLSQNNIDSLPNEIGNLINIQDLILNQNVIAQLPPEIAKLTKLRFLDLWGNEIQEFPDEITKLNNTLKVVDLRVISIPAAMQEKIEQQLPAVKVFFSFNCNCN